MIAILLACLISATDCREVELYLLERVPTAAAIEAQTRAARWLEQHPGMVMKSVRVVPARNGVI